MLLFPGDDDSIPICNMINIYAKKIRINSILIGNVEKYIDPFFDIDFQRYITKLLNKNKEKVYVCISSFNEMSIRFLSSALNDMEFKEKVQTIIFSNETTKEKTESIFKKNITSNFGILIETIENEIK